MTDALSYFDERNDKDSLRYESLRFQILNKGHYSGGRLGLAMFIDQGMLTWITTWRRFDSTDSSTKKQVHKTPILPPKVQSEITHVLANMALLNLGDSE